MSWNGSGHQILAEELSDAEDARSHSCVFGKEAELVPDLRAHGMGAERGRQQEAGEKKVRRVSSALESFAQSTEDPASERHTSTARTTPGFSLRRARICCSLQRGVQTRVSETRERQKAALRELTMACT